MKDFPAPDSLSTLAIARETYGNLLAAYHERDGEIQQLTDDLGAANELIDENVPLLDKRDKELKAKGEQLAQSKRDLITAKQTIKSLEDQIESLESEAQSADEKAAEICASVGVDPLLIKPEEEGNSQSFLEQYRAIKDPGQRTAFYRKHKDEIIAGK